MRIEELDRNLAIVTDVNEPDIVWLDAKQAPCSLHGVTYDAEQGCYVRMPQKVADTVSKGVAALNRCTAGGRIRFKTDSSFLAIRAVQKNRAAMPHMPRTGQSGFDVYRKNEAGFDTYYASLIPPADVKEGFSSPKKTDGAYREYTINFPLYDEVSELYIALKKDARIAPPDPYEISAPIVYYGSSITQGGCASRPGNSYQAMISRRMNADYVNLGFSGCGKAEREMADYLADICQNASALVCNYDWNAPTEEYLQATHLPLYRTVREKNPTLPILVLSEPEIVLYPQKMAPRLEIIRRTYLTARAEGDERIWFLPGNKIYEGEHWDACTVDGCHPNDLGFFRMATAIEPYLREMLTKN